MLLMTKSGEWGVAKIVGLVLLLLIVLRTLVVVIFLGGD